MARTNNLLVLLVVLLTATFTNAFAPAIGANSPLPATSVCPRTTALYVDIKVEIDNGEPIESALRRFKREVNKSGHLMELRHRRYFENTQERKKRKVKEARLRRKFERMNKRRMANRTLNN